MLFYFFGNLQCPVRWISFSKEKFGLIMYGFSRPGVTVWRFETGAGPGGLFLEARFMGTESKFR